ncbi:MAG: class I SAM-dependent methyltransferase [Chloroflexota bacterium]|nr:class I SAM-dependent methyltransferase [Chloroflexota bacterium]
MPNKVHHEINRLSWNEATKAHNSHKGDQAAFFRAGGSTLFEEEKRLLGDIAGKTLLHLQCNCGQDSLSIANHLGAIVTGVDISDEAIDFARQLSRDSGIPAEYIRADIYDFFANNQTQYDLVFASYGALVWLSDLDAWAKGIRRCLKRGGTFVFIDFHPALLMFGENWQLKYDYMGGSFVEFESGIGDYVALTGSAGETDELQAGIQDFVNPHPGVEYLWGLADVISALISAGFALVGFGEYPHCNGFKPMTDMRDAGDRRYAMPDRLPQRFPLMFSLVARKP